MLRPSLQARAREDLYLAGQLIGVEGYLESTSMGWLAGVNVARRLSGHEPLLPPTTTSLGSLLHYVTDENRKNFQPINANYGLFPPLPGRTRKGRERRLKQAERALAEIEPFSALAVADLAPAGPG